MAFFHLTHRPAGGAPEAPPGALPGAPPGAPPPRTAARFALPCAEVLLWQSGIRVVMALVVATVELLLLGTGALQGAPGRLAIGAVLYALVVVVLALLAREHERLSRWVVTATVLADVAFVFGATVVASAPQYYGRVLILSFVLLHLTVYYFGAGQGLVALGAVVGGYLVLMASQRARGAPVRWAEEGWTMAVFVLVAGVFVLHYGTLWRRLRRLVELFASAEEGEFADAYDVAADRRPDAITLVGRAYNLLRTHLATMVLSDTLTGCLNRRGFEQHLARELARGSRAGSAVGLLAIDLDHFKQVNDSYGHLAGDQVLREVGALLRDTARAGDVVARTGGEEFAMLLPDTDVPGALNLAERVRERFAAHRFMLAGRPVRVTASVGATADLAGDASAAAALRARADEALYRAKRAGRNRVELWAPRRVPDGSAGRRAADRRAAGERPRERPRKRSGRRR